MIAFYRIMENLRFSGKQSFSDYRRMPRSSLRSLEKSGPKTNYFPPEFDHTASREGALCVVCRWDAYTSF